MIAWLVTALSPVLALAATGLAGVCALATVRGLDSHRRIRVADHELVRVTTPRCPICTAPTIDWAGRRCGCWSGR